MAAPPKFSASVVSPTAAFTKYGPAKKIEPAPSTISVSSLIMGKYAPPATQAPVTAAIWVMPIALIFALFLNILPKCSLSAKISSCMGKKTPALSTI